MKQTKKSMKMLIAGGLLLCVMSLGSCNKEAQTKPPVQSNSEAFDESALAGSPIAWWKFDSTFKENIQQLQGLKHAQATFSTTAKAKYGIASFLSKDSGYVSTASAGTSLPAISSGLTVDFWVFPFAKTGGAQCVFALPQTGSFWPNMHVLLDGYNANQGDSGLIKVMFKANKPGVTYIEQWTQAGGIPNFYNNWSHIQYSYNGTTSKYTLKVNNKKYFDHVILYDSGDTLTRQPLGNLAFIDTHGFVTAAFQNKWDPTLWGPPEVWMLPFKGRIDNLKIYNTANF